MKSFWAKTSCYKKMNKKVTFSKKTTLHTHLIGYKIRGMFSRFLGRFPFHASLMYSKMKHRIKLIKRKDHRQNMLDVPFEHLIDQNVVHRNTLNLLLEFFSTSSLPPPAIRTILSLLTRLKRFHLLSSHPHTLNVFVRLSFLTEPNFLISIHRNYHPSHRAMLVLHWNDDHFRSKYSLTSYFDTICLCVDWYNCNTGYFQTRLWRLYVFSLLFVNKSLCQTIEIDTEIRDALFPVPTELNNHQQPNSNFLRIHWKQRNCFFFFVFGKLEQSSPGQCN